MELMYRLNPDSSTRTADQSKGGSSTSTEKSLMLRNDQAHRSIPPCGLCVRATVEEHAEHKDIRVRISDISAFVNNDGEKEKTAVVKFCTPLVCEGSTRRISSINKVHEKSAPEVNASFSSPHIAEAYGSNSKEIQTSTESPRTETPRSSLSSKINKTLRSLNCRGNSNSVNKNRPDRDEGGSRENKIENESSTYDTSKTTTMRSQSFDTMENFGERENSEAADESLAAAETLRILQRLLENAGKPEVGGKRGRTERSRSVPRGGRRESDLGPSNLSFPVRVDCSCAGLTAADLTRPEFVRMLTEIKEQTRNLEEQLSRMNSTMRSASFNDAVSGRAEQEKSTLLKKIVNLIYESGSFCAQTGILKMQCRYISSQKCDSVRTSHTCQWFENRKKSTVFSISESMVLHNDNGKKLLTYK